jgi:hypothetical protein
MRVTRERDEVVGRLTGLANAARRICRGNQRAAAVVDLAVTVLNDAVTPQMDILRPYLLVACVAFTVGFIGYWMIGRAIAPAGIAQESFAPVAAAPTGDSNFLKHI